MQSLKPYVLCVDVGGPERIGWADVDGRDGTGADLGDALDRLSWRLRNDGWAALGFEAPIWTPTRTELSRLTARRGGVETTYNRAWSAGAGGGVLCAALALMPWCLARIAGIARPVTATVCLRRFRENGGLFLWEAFVSGKMKVVGASHQDDARHACQAFIARWPELSSDIPPEAAINHAVSSAMAAGLSIELDELVLPALVISVAPTP